MTGDFDTLPWPKKNETAENHDVDRTLFDCVTPHSIRNDRRTAAERDFCPAFVIEHIEQCSFFVMILGCLSFFWRGSRMQPESSTPENQAVPLVHHRGLQVTRMPKPSHVSCKYIEIGSEPD